MEDYTPIPYPKCLYHPEKGACVVQNAEEQEALGGGWSESPGGEAVVAVKAKPAKAKKEKSDANGE